MSVAAQGAGDGAEPPAEKAEEPAPEKKGRFSKPKFPKKAKKEVAPKVNVSNPLLDLGSDTDSDEEGDVENPPPPTPTGPLTTDNASAGLGVRKIADPTITVT